MSKHKLFVENQYSFHDSILGSNECTDSFREYAEDSVSLSSYICTKNKGEKKTDYRTITKRTELNYVLKNQFHPANMSQSPVKCTLTDKIEASKAPDPKRSEGEPSQSPLGKLHDLKLMENSFFSSFNQKLPYSKEEDELILKHVLKGQNIFKVTSILLWKHLESKKGNPKRTYQSLKNRFLRNIKPVIFTTYGHLIKNKETRDMILTKFPELKKQMRIGETLSRIQIPLGNHREKTPEVIAPSGTPNFTGKNLQKSLESVQSPPAVSSDSISPQNLNFHRQVKFKNNSLTVLVDFNNRNQKDTYKIPLLLNERFKKVNSNIGPFVCPVCGRGSRSKVAEILGSKIESESESESLIPNSLDTDRGDHNSKKLKSSQNNRKKINSRASKSNLRSQSLLTYEEQDEDEDNGGSVEGKKISLKEKTKDHEDNSQKTFGGDSQRGDEEDNLQSNKEFPGALSSSKEFNSETKKGHDSDIDLIYENTMASFRKLINADNEKLLFKKCLYKNRDSIGLDFDSEKNLDSYFLESSLDEKTPLLTIDYATDSEDGDITGKKSEKKDNFSPPSNTMTIVTRERAKKMKS